MSKTIDERVVSMKFDRNQFENGIKSTLGALEALKRGLKLDGAAKGLKDVGTAGKNMNLEHIGASVDGIAQRFSVMGIAGVAAIANIANRAVNAGVVLGKSLTIAPISAGLQEYETNLNSIQTILANTKASGASLTDVNDALQKLNVYSDQTIYNFSQMARNIGTFTAAGVDLKTSTASIKGIANLAALSGSNSEQASSAMYQLSQAIASGKVSLMDWNSVVNAGMGGTVFQRALAQTAVEMGKLPSSAVKLEGKMKNVKIAGESFRDSISASGGKASWLSSEVLTNTLKQFTGDMTAAELKAQGFNKTQIQAIQNQAAMAKAAATEVKTFSGLMDTTKESIGSGWSQTWQNIIGDFEEAKTLWTGVSQAIGKFVDASSEGRNKVLADWKRLGGRTAIIEGIKNVFNGLIGVLKPIKDAFTEIFPPATGAQLARMSKNFLEFTKGLKMGGETAKNLKTTFKGVFAIFSIFTQVIKGVVGYVLDFIGLFNGGQGSVLSFTASIAEFLIKIDEWLKKSHFIQKFFDTLHAGREKVMAPLIDFIQNLIEAFGLLLRGDFTGFADKLKDGFGGLIAIYDAVSDALRDVIERFREFGGSASAGVEKAIEKISGVIDGLRAKLDILRGGASDKLELVSFSVDGGAEKAATTFETLKNAAVTTAEVIKSIWTSLGDFFGGIGDFFAPLLTTLQELFVTIGEKLKVWIQGMDMTDAVALVNTGFFIALYIAARRFVGHLKDFTTQIGDTFAAVGESITETFSLMQKSIKTDVILKIAIAIGIMAASLYLLSNIEPKKMATALGGIAALLIMLTVTMSRFMKVLEVVDKEGVTPASIGKILAMGVALILLSTAVLILSHAVQNLAGLSWGDMIKGLIGVAGLLAGLMLFTKIADANSAGIKAGVGLILLAVAIRLLVNSVAKLGEMDEGKLKQGAAAIMALLTMMAGTAIAFSQLGNKGVPGIIAMAGALAILTPVIIGLGMVPYETLAKGLGVLAIALGLMAGTAVVMSKWGNKGAPGVIAMAGAIAILTPAIIALGLIPYENLAKGLGTIAIALGLLVGASILMGQPQTIKGAAAMILIAAALGALVPVILLLGQADMETLAKGLGALGIGLALILAAGLAAMYVGPGLLILGKAIMLLGVAAMLAGVGMALFGTGFALLAATGVAGVAVLVAAFMAFLNLLPLIAQQVGLAVIAFAVVISTAGPKITAALTTVLNSLLQAVIDTLPKLEELIIKLVDAILRILVDAIPKMVDAGFKILIGILDGIAKNIGKVAEKAVDIVVNFIQALSDSRDRLIQAGVDYILDFIEGLTEAIEENSERMGEAGGDLAAAIIEGMAAGLTAGASRVAEAAGGVAKDAWEAAKEFLKVNSPSKRFMELGDSADEGFAMGFDRSAGLVTDSAESVGHAAIDSMRKTLSGLSDLVSGDIDMNPTITPVLDLSGVKKNASQIGSLLGTNSLSVDSTYASAKDASAGYDNNQLAFAETAAQMAEPKVEFNQTNISPEPISSARVYRNTQTQLSAAKGALTPR